MSLFDTDKGIKVDHNRIVTVYIKSKLNSDEVFVLASQATQVFWAPNVVNSKSPWYTIVTTKTQAFDGTSLSEHDKVLQENVCKPSYIVLNDDDVVAYDVVDIPDEVKIEYEAVVNNYVVVEDDNDEENNDEEEETESQPDNDVDSDGFDDVV